MAEPSITTQELASIMISYSRKDKEFVQNLQGALSASGIPEENIWIDWDDIPPAADWMDEITRAIGAADAFVFVISPDSLNSKVCGEELRIALENNKKLVPILYREAQAGDPIPSIVSKTNWIFMNQEGSIEAQIPTLLEAINTDLEWVREHTRTLERAIEWDQQGRDKSFLLRGVDLEAAESWQADAVQGKEPQPTHLQAIYIQTSRQDAKRRRRNLLIGVTVALVVSIALGITALFQWQEAQEQSEINLVRQLSAQATSKKDQRLDLASLLSLEAIRLSERRSTVSDISRAEVVGSLLSVVTHKPALNGYIHGHTARVVDVAIHLDARLIATASEDGTVRLIDADTLKLRHLFQEENDFLITAAISPDGNQVAIGATSGIISLWDSKSLRLMSQISSEHDQGIFRILFSPDGNSIVTAGLGGKVIEYNAATLEQKRVIIEDIPVRSLAFDSTGSKLVIGGDDGIIDIFDMANGDHIQSIDFGFSTSAVAFSADGSILATGSFGNVDLWDLETGKAIDQFEYPGVISVNSLVFDPLGEFLAMGSDNRNVFLLGLQAEAIGFNGEIDLLSAHVGEIFDIDISSDGSVLLSGGIDQTAILWDVIDGLKGGGSDIQTIYSYHENDVNEVAFSPDGRLMASASDDTQIYIQDLTGDEDDRQVFTAHEERVVDVSFDPTGKLLASSDSNGVIILWDVDNGQMLGDFLYHGDGSDVSWLPLAFSPQGGILASGSADATIIIWDIATGQQVGETIPAHSDNVFSLAFSPDGKTLASGSLDFSITLWDMETYSEILTFDHEAQVQSLIFSPDGDYLFSGGFDALIKIWDVNSGVQVDQLTGHLGDVTDLAFSSDETLLASASTDGNVILWDVQSLERIGYLSGSPASLIGLAFSPTEPLVAAASRDDNIYVWETDLETWKKLACFRANRNLTQDEWDRYIGTQEEYHLTCPEFPSPEN